MTRRYIYKDAGCCTKEKQREKYRPHTHHHHQQYLMALSQKGFVPYSLFSPDKQRRENIKTKKEEKKYNEASSSSFFFCP